MEKIKETIAHAKQWMTTPRMKKRMYVALVIILAGWVVFRFAVIGAQNRLQVYNPARAAISDGVQVATLEMQRVSGIVREPLTVKNNRAYVSGARAKLLRSGMKVDDGSIVSVSSNIDLDTGMHVVHTRGVTDGQHMAEFRATGYFIPVSAIDNGAVYVARNGLAVRTPVVVSRQDMDTAYVTSGLKEGDVLILSRVADGTKVNINK